MVNCMVGGCVEGDGQKGVSYIYACRHITIGQDYPRLEISRWTPCSHTSCQTREDVEASFTSGGGHGRP